MFEKTLEEMAPRINKLLDVADLTGDSATILGALILLSAPDEAFAKFGTMDVSLLDDLLKVEQVFIKAGVDVLGPELT
jgi:hypothetical protein